MMRTDGRTGERHRVNRHERACTFKNTNLHIINVCGSGLIFTRIEIEAQSVHRKHRHIYLRQNSNLIGVSC